MLTSKALRKSITLVLAALTITSCAPTAPEASSSVQEETVSSISQDESQSSSSASSEGSENAQSEIQEIKAQPESTASSEAPASQVSSGTASPAQASSASSAPATTENKATAIAFNKSTDLTLNVGDTNTRSVATTPAGLPITYTSSEPAVATVATDGNVTCLAEGSTVITATSGSETATYNLTVAANAANLASAPKTPANSGQEQTYSSVGDDKISESVSIDGYAQEVVALTNAQRRSAGLHELEWDSSLMEAAQVRAEEIATSFSHTRPDGTGGAAFALSFGSGWGSENIAKGSKTPSSVVKGWMNSEGHRNNILNSSGDNIGVGCYKGKNGTIYWVQLFCGGGSSSSGGANTNKGDDADDADDNDASKNEGNSTGGGSSKATYSINETSLQLTAGDGFQLSVDSDSDSDYEVTWAGPGIGENVLSVDDSGYVTTYYRDGMTSAKATLTVSAKVYSSGKLVKTLRCKVVVTQ